MSHDGTARVINTLMEDNKYFNHKCFKDMFIFEKKWQLDPNFQMIKRLNAFL